MARPVIRVKLASGVGATMDRMRRAAQTISIQPDVPHAGCQACLQSEAGPVCHAVGLEPATPPRLVGPAAEVHRLMAALALNLGFAMPPGAEFGLVRAMVVLPDEVTLELAVGRQCGGQGLIDIAFQTLRTLLPDTDIYVLTGA